MGRVSHRRRRRADSAEALSLARRIVDLASDKLASDIVLLDIRGVSLIADYFVICTVASERQATAILKDLSDKLLEDFGRKPLHTRRQARFGLGLAGLRRRDRARLFADPADFL